MSGLIGNILVKVVFVISVASRCFCLSILLTQCHMRFGPAPPPYSFLQNPWRERPFGSRPRNFLPDTPPNARRRHFALHKYRITIK